MTNIQLGATNGIFYPEYSNPHPSNGRNHRLKACHITEKDNPVTQSTLKGVQHDSPLFQPFRLMRGYDGWF